MNGRTLREERRPDSSYGTENESPAPLAAHRQTVSQTKIQWPYSRQSGN